MSDIDIQINDNSEEVAEKLKAALLRGLTKIGMQAEKYAKQLCPVDTGRLRNSITNQVKADEEAVYIGTNVEYAPYVECGTGRQSTAGGNPLINGMAPRPYLRPAASNHMEVYAKLIKSEVDKAIK